MGQKTCYSQSNPQSTHRVATEAFLRTFLHGKISSGWCECGVHAHPVSLRSSCVGRYKYPVSSLPICVLCGFTTPPPPHPLSKSGLKLFCNVNIVYGNLSESSQDYARKPQRNFMFMNSASVWPQRILFHRFLLRFIKNNNEA